MYQEHKYFKLPDNDSVKIWHYMKYKHFVELLETKKLFFSSPNSFDDPREGCPNDADFNTIHELRDRCKDENIQILLTELYNTDTDIETISFLKDLIDNYSGKEIEVPLTQIILNMRKNRSRNEIVIKCFHMNECESKYMWDKYTEKETGIAIQSNFKRLQDCFSNNKPTVFLGKITYINEELKTVLGNDYCPFLYKREKDFVEEKEIRAIVAFEDTEKEDEDEDDDENVERKGMYVNISLDTLIEKIYISPTSSNEFLEKVKFLVKTYGLNKEVFYSELSN